MSSVYFPVHVVVILRRLVNVISTISISNQYLLLKQAKAEEKRVHAELTELEPQSSANTNRYSDLPSWRAFHSLRAAEWTWETFMDGWTWPRRLLPPDVAYPERFVQSQSQQGNVAAKASSFSLPWLGRHWSWPSMLTLSTESEFDLRGDPLRPTKRPRDPRSSQDSPKPPPRDPETDAASLDTIHQLIQNPALYDPLRTPRYPIVLCHGLYGFDSRGPSSFPSMRMHYWSNVLNVLRDKVGAEVIVTSVPGTGSIIARSGSMDRQLQERARGRGVNFLAHSMGGLDCRHLISHVKPTEYAPLSLTTISTPHRGSPFMDWCAENIGIGKLHQQEKDLAKALNPETLTSSLSSAASDAPFTNAYSKSNAPKPDAPFSLSLASLPSSFTTLLLSIVDSPAYANLTSAYLNDIFNPATPDDPRVKYFSVAGRMPGASIWHPFWLPKMVLDGAEEKERSKLRTMWEQGSSEQDTPLWAQDREWGNDGLVTVQSAKWGEFLGIMEGCDHWEMRGARGIEFGVDLPAIPAIGLGSRTNGTGDGWGLGDWGRFATAWRKEEKIQRDAAAEASEPAHPTVMEREQERKRERDRDDAVIKSSTDKLSAVLDWLIEQVPSPPRLGAKSKMFADTQARTVEDVAEMREKVSELRDQLSPSKPSKERAREVKKDKAQKNELAHKLDLERFYVALSRKLYDEGL